MFTIYSDSSTDSTMVSNLFIDEYMTSANDAQIKVYLYLLRMMGVHRPTSISDMADHFNHTEKDVVRSLRYWEKKGLLDLTFGREDDLVSICLRSLAPPADSAPAQSGALPKAGAAAAQDSALSQNNVLSQGASFQQSGVRTDNRVLRFSAPAEIPRTETVVEPSRLRMAAGGTYEDNSGQPLPANLFSGAAGQASPGSSSTAAAERTAGSGPSKAAAGLPSTEGAKQAAGSAAPAKGSRTELEVLESFRRDAGRAQLLFVIEQYIGKPLSLNEVRTVFHISEDLCFSDELIDYLLQYCVDRGKKDFRYIRKVAESWAKDGITTPSQAEALRKEAPAAGKAEKRTRKPSGSGRTANSFNRFEQNNYDFDALEEELLQ